jgi:hypothetical protein
MPLSTWSYRGEESSVRHIGPTAQDFFAAFGFGGDEMAIATVDADGVALAAIQGLYELARQQSAWLDAQDAEIEAQGESLAAKDRQLAEQAAEIEALEERLAALEAMMRELAGQWDGGAP